MMSTELDEQLRSLGEFAISEPRPLERIAERGQQIQRRRRALTASLVGLLLVVAVAGVASALGARRSRVNVVSSRKEIGELQRVSGYVVPKDSGGDAFARVQQVLERAAVVEQYVIMPPGWAAVRLAMDQCGQSPCVPAKADRLPLACAALHTRSFAVQLARTPAAANRLRDELGGDATLYTSEDLGDVEIWMNVKATSAQATRLRSAIAADPDVASYRFLDHQASYREFAIIERDNRALLASVSPGDLPESFRLYLSTSASPAAVEHRYQSFPGVQQALLPGQPLNGPFDDAYLRWLRGSQRSGAPQPTAPFGNLRPAVNPCDTSR